MNNLDNDNNIKSIKLKLLGEFSLIVDNSRLTVAELGSKICSLITYLALNKDREITLNELTEALWTKELDNPRHQ